MEESYKNMVWILIELETKKIFKKSEKFLQKFYISFINTF